MTTAEPVSHGAVWMNPHATEHPAYRELFTLAGQDKRLPTAAFGFLLRCATWAARHGTAPVVPAAVADDLADSPELAREYLRIAAAAGLVTDCRDTGASAPGWQLLEDPGFWIIEPRRPGIAPDGGDR